MCLAIVVTAKDITSLEEKIARNKNDQKKFLKDSKNNIKK